MESHKNDDAAYRYSTSEEGEVFAIVIAGKFTMEMILSLKDRVNDTAIAGNVKKMLVDVSGVKTDIGYSETYLIAMMTPPYFDNIPTAVVHAPEHSHLARFYEDLISKNGLPVKCFTDTGKAKNWLKKSIRKKSDTLFH